MTTETMTRYGREFTRTAHGGWLETGATMPEGSTARVCGDAVVFAEAARRMYDGVFHGGEFWGGEFWGGEFRGGEFRGGEFRGGEFWGGEFRGGEFRGGVFRGGEFWGGEFWGGVFHGGVFRDGVFRGGVFRGGVFWDGEFWQSPSCAQRSDGHMFVSKFVDGDLRIWAGCRNFSWDQAVAHWNDAHRHGAESQRIIHFLRAQAEAERDRDAAR
jgi:hypothetical protein